MFSQILGVYKNYKNHKSRISKFKLKQTFQELIITFSKSEIKVYKITNKVALHYKALLRSGAKLLLFTTHHCLDLELSYYSSLHSTA